MIGRITFPAALMALTILMPASGPAAVAAASVAACAPRDGVQFVCGVASAEDLVRLAGTNWVVTSSFNMRPDLPAGPGPLLAVTVDTHQVHTLYPAADATVKWDSKLFADCPAPPKFISTQGINVRALGAGRFRIYATNHAERESIEVIDVEVAGGALRASWRGCLVLPRGVEPNGVAPLPGEDLVVTGGAKVGGGVAIWRARKGWREVPTLVGRTNGVEASPDGKWVYVAASDQETVIRFPADSDMSQRQTVRVGFHTDNLRWGDDGMLYVAGPVFPAGTAGALACFRKRVCDAGYAAAKIDPETLTSKELLRSPGLSGTFGAATTALTVGDQIWMGTFYGDRLAIVTTP